MATKVSHGCIQRAEDKSVATTASRTRMNLTGALDLVRMKLVTTAFDTIDGSAVVDFLKYLKENYKDYERLHVILEQSGYHKSQVVRDYAEANGLVLHYLPPYSPNLNPIERAWKVMNETVRNNRTPLKIHFYERFFCQQRSHNSRIERDTVPLKLLRALPPRTHLK